MTVEKKRFLPIVIVLYALSAVIALYTLFATILLGYSAGVLLLILASMVCFLVGRFYSFLRKHRFVWWLLVTVAVVVLLFLIFLFIFGHAQTQQSSVDVVIVLGAEVKGTTLSDHLKARLDTAFTYLEMNPDVIIALSGGQGKGEAVSEAEAMKRYLVDKGIHESRILLEDCSTSTYENLTFCQTLLSHLFQDDYQALIVTSDYHIFRTSLMAKKLGYSASYLAAKTRWYEYPYRVARECIAIGKLILLGC